MATESSEHVSVCILPENDRTREIRDAFAALHKKEAEFYIRVPGRVNLIGEHIDYCGYSVCPMALEQDILLAVSVEDDRLLHLHNVDLNFEDYCCDLRQFDIAIGEGAPQWYEYFLCGLKGIFEILPKDISVRGMKIVVSGTIPQSAGLSSSSALVSAAALATSHAHKFPLTKEKMANLCAQCERYIGTQGGGMDQAIAFLATEGCAKLIEFNPLRSTDIVLPPGAVFVIAHSLTNLNKAATADFNCRVIECRLSAQVIAKKQGLHWMNIKRLGELQQALGLDLTDMIALVKETLHEQPYTKEEVVQELETTIDHLDATSLTQNTKHIRSFKLRQRALHVFQEALRVRKFHETCLNSTGEGSLETLGKLMLESHESLRDLYECSHPQLDKLVDLSREFTLGTRLTGAGWGGCAVSLLPPNNVDRYIHFLRENFYKPFGLTDKLNTVLFSTSPQSGACVYLNRV
ncbi:N-acetylgalactosamine kinase [Anoplophora glabripennis]|uniref:N-acetylgalactosamine kinase n=1 Tax=Anoplophora glabripennis TaxID=217634 RepID=UPI000873B5F4|nr:N-acetylgalactosamine kinase [Anoplophora glabripennis]